MCCKQMSSSRRQVEWGRNRIHSPRRHLHGGRGKVGTDVPAGTMRGQIQRALTMQGPGPGEGPTQGGAPATNTTKGPTDKLYPCAHPEERGSVLQKFVFSLCGTHSVS